MHGCFLNIHGEHHACGLDHLAWGAFRSIQPESREVFLRGHVHDKRASKNGFEPQCFACDTLPFFRSPRPVGIWSSSQRSTSILGVAWPKYRCLSVLWADRGTALRTSEQNPQLSWRFQPVEHVHLLGSLGPPLKVALFWADRGANLRRKPSPVWFRRGKVPP